MEKAANYKKFILLPFIASCILLSSYVQAQNNPLSKKVVLNITLQTLENALNAIEQSADVHFSYNSEMLAVDSIISLNTNVITVEEALDQLLGKKYYYKTSGKYIIILRKGKTDAVDKSLTRYYTISGIITNSITGERVMRASIIDMDNMTSTISDVNGKFVLNVSPERRYVNLGCSRKTYVDTVILIQPATSGSLQIQLMPEFESINKITPRPAQIDGVLPFEEHRIVKTMIRDDALAHAANLEIFETRPFQLSFLPFAGTNHRISGAIVNRFSLNLIGGYSNGLKGVEIGGMMNMNKSDVKGLQIGGFGNITGGNVQGAQVAGFFNHTLGKSSGAQIAGFSNTLMDTLKGVQIAGFSNVLNGKSDGAQISGFTNISKGDNSGFQISGFSNITIGSSRSVQCSGFSNFVSHDLTGVQVSGFSNIAKNNCEGIQISGFLNYARKVKGVQLSVINIADTVSGFSLGFLTFVRKGYHGIQLFTDEMSAINLHFHTGTYRFYNIFGISSQPFATEKSYGITYGVGSWFMQPKKISLSTELTTTNISIDKLWDSGSSRKTRLSVDLYYRLNKSLLLSLGGGYNLLLSDTNNDAPRNFISETTPFHVTHHTDHNTVYSRWLGASVGMEITF